MPFFPDTDNNYVDLFPTVPFSTPILQPHTETIFTMPDFVAAELQQHMEAPKPVTPPPAPKSEVSSIYTDSKPSTPPISVIDGKCNPVWFDDEDYLEACSMAIIWGQPVPSYSQWQTSTSWPPNHPAASTSTARTTSSQQERCKWSTPPTVPTSVIDADASTQSRWMSHNLTPRALEEAYASAYEGEPLERVSAREANSDHGPNNVIDDVESQQQGIETKEKRKFSLMDWIRALFSANRS